MREASYTRTGQQCRHKIKKLEAEYKKVKDGNKEIGNNRRTRNFCAEMDEVMGSKPTICPPVIHDTFHSASPVTEPSEVYQNSDHDSDSLSITGSSTDQDHE